MIWVHIRFEKSHWNITEKSYIDNSLYNMLLSIHLSSSGQYIWNNTTTSVRYNIFKSFLVRWPSFKGLCQWQSTKILVIYHKTTFCLVPLRPFAWTNTHFPLVGTTLIGYRLDDNFLTVFCMESRNKRYSETKIQQQRHSTIQPWLNLMETHYNKKNLILHFTSHILDDLLVFEKVCTSSVNTFDLNA